MLIDLFIVNAIPNRFIHTFSSWYRIEHNHCNNTFEIDEEIEGYKEAIEILPKAFNGIEEDWFFEVAFPAFETNMKTIWKRE